MTKDSSNDVVALILDRSKWLKGLSLVDLGAAPDPSTMSEQEKGEYELDHLEELAALSPEERQHRLRQAQLLGGALWSASVIMVDQLFDDLRTVSELTEITPADINGTRVLDNLPARFAHHYGPLFVQKFIVVTADLTASLARSWRSPDCVAAELAVRCLLDETETVVELHGLDVPERWRQNLEDMMVQDFDYDMLYDRSLDGFEDDQQFLDDFRITPMRFEDWFKPFTDQYAVPPYVQD